MNIYEKIIVNNITQCWEWQGRKNEKGYGRSRCPNRKKEIGVHRISFEIKNGPIPSGMEVCHHCDVRHCINPGHLFLATHYENIQDAVKKGRMKGSVGPFVKKNRGLANDYTSCKLTEKEVLEIREKYTLSPKYGSFSKLAQEYRISPDQIANIVKRKQWKHI